MESQFFDHPTEGDLGAFGMHMGDRPHSGDTSRSIPPCATNEVEPGWLATRALMQMGSEDLLRLMLRPSFRPVRDLELVPVAPCQHCQDGGMRTAGSIRSRRGRELVHACDTCGVIRVGQTVLPPSDLPHAEA